VDSRLRLGTTERNPLTSLCFGCCCFVVVVVVVVVVVTVKCLAWLSYLQFSTGFLCRV
jgi:hypothetical protein